MSETRGVFRRGIAMMAALLASIVPGPVVRTSRHHRQSLPSQRKSGRGPARFTRAGNPGPQTNLFGIPWARLRSSDLAERAVAEDHLHDLRHSKGSQAVLRDKRNKLRTARGAA